MILNLTQHPATPEQLAAGVVDLVGDDLARLKRLLTFEDFLSTGETVERAQLIAEWAGLHDPFPERAMIGGAPWLMAPLAAALREHCIQPVFAFSVRDVQEQVHADGIRKVVVFRHEGFVYPF